MSFLKASFQSVALVIIIFNSADLTQPTNDDAKYISASNPYPLSPGNPGSSVEVDCECDNAKLRDLYARMDLLEISLATVNRTVKGRLTNLEQNYYNVLSNRVTDLQVYVDAQTSLLNNNIVESIDTVLISMNSKLREWSERLEDEISKSSEELAGILQSTVIGVDTKISKLESGKVQTLINYNELWKQNFRTVNSTLSKLRKQLLSN